MLDNDLAALDAARQEWQAIQAQMNNPKLTLLTARRLYRRLGELAQRIEQLEKGES